MIQILKYDLKQLFRENFFLVIVLSIITTINFSFFSTSDIKNNSHIFSLYGIGIIIFLLDILNKGVRLTLIVNFPRDTIFFLQYLSFKFQALSLIGLSILLILIKLFFDIALLSLIPFFISSTYLSLLYFFIISLYLRKRSYLDLIDVMILALILLIALVVSNILFYIIEIWTILPILVIAILFNLFIINKVSAFIAPVIFDILENSNESN